VKKKPVKSRAIVRRSDGVSRRRLDFDLVLALIDAARERAVSAVNTAMIDLYWSIGQHIASKIAGDGWGQGTVNALAEYIRRRQPNARSFSAQNLWRMRQFYEACCDQPKLSALLRELPWTHNLLILNRSRRDKERGFYLRTCVREKWSKRELQRQVNGALFERLVLSPTILSPPARELHPDAATVLAYTA